MGEDEVKLGVDVLLVTLQQLKEMASKNNANSRFLPIRGMRANVNSCVLPLGCSSGDWQPCQSI